MFRRKESLALIECMKTKKKVYLQSYHIFGRHTIKTDTYLDNKDISQLHASIRWEGTRWIIIDHSRNGTFISDRRLPEGKSVEITVGDLIRFGGSPDSCWTVIDLSPPAAILVSLKDETQIIKLKQFQIFPDEENPEISIYLFESGKWKYEKGEQVDFLNNGDIIEINSLLWRFCNANAEASTLNNKDTHEKDGAFKPGPEFRFYVSQDEEHVIIKVFNESELYSLGERAHHYLLLTLARRRIEDFTNRIDPLSQGWIGIDQLSRMLDLDQCHLNIQIFRARKQIQTVLPDAPYLVNVIERRTGDIRFGIPRFKIYSGSRLEGACTLTGEV